jgi:hypothetical protein
MRRIYVLAVLLSFCAGCTAQAVRRQTVAQAATWMDIQYRQVIENLAMVANNPDVLPCYSVQDYGSSNVSDKVSLVGGLTIPPLGTATTGVIDPNASRAITDNWTLTQVTAPEKLRALQLAFKYAVYNDPTLLVVHDNHVTLDAFTYPRDPNCPDEAKTLCCVKTPSDGDPCGTGYPGEPGYYFNVAHELLQICPGWLKVGKKKDVPKCARFTARCGDTYAWVNNEGMNAFSSFTIVVHRIARQVVAQAFCPPIDTVVIDMTPCYSADGQLCYPHGHIPVIWNCCYGSSQPDDHTIKSYVQSVTVPMNCYGDVMIAKARLDSIVTSDSKLKSAVTAATSTKSQ